MEQHTYPFLTFKDAHGNNIRPPSTYLPVRISNPETGLSIVTYALVDTGADNCVIPESIAVSLGHNFNGHGVQSDSTQGVSGTTPVFMHTFDIDILTADRTKTFFSVSNVLIACVSQDIPVLLGVADCLNRFKLTVDYSAATTMLQY